MLGPILIWLGALAADARYAFRTLRKAPAFALAATLTMALGIAANTVIFSVVNAALIRSLPYAAPDRLMQVAERNDRLNLPYFSASALNYLSWKEQTRTFQGLGAFGFATYTLTGGGEPEQVVGGPVSPSLVPLLGVKPVAGRAFREGEDKAGSAPVVMISEALWKRRFGSNPGAVNTPLTVNGTVYTLVGVMGPELNLLTGGDLWVPMAIDQTRENRLSHVISVIGRLRDGVTIETAQAEMDAISRRVVEQYPDVRDWTIRIRTFSDWFVSSELRTALAVLMGAVVLVLLIVCANVANLLLSRTVARQKEFAIRAAMGGSRARIGCQLIVEGLVLSLAGGAGGLLLASWAVGVLNAMPAAQQPVTGVRIDAAVLLFTLAASLVTGVLFGLAPAWHGMRADLNLALRQGTRSSTGHVRPFLRNGQAAAQLALATVLVVGAGLLAQSLLRLERVPLGFDASNVLTFRLSLPTAKYPNHAGSWAFYKRLAASVETLPGVRGVAISSGLPFGAGAYTRTPVTTPNRSALPVGTQIPIDWRVVNPGYFRTLGIPLVRGRDFTEQDAPDAAPVMVVSRSLARRFWGDDDPIGKTLHLVNARGSQKADYTVVGVVGDVRNVALNEELPAMYYSSSFRLWPSMEVAIRTQGAPEAVLPAVRQQVRALDPELPMSAVQTLEQAISGSASQQRFNAVLLTVFASVALIIAAIGVYGVLAYSVSQRTHEIGLRMALGAERQTVMRLVLGEGMAVGALGLAAGLAGALGASRVLGSLLFGIEARDPVTFGAAAFVLATVAMIACGAPAWRASRVDPVVALRGE
jgi:putative ABC transport system permease protein